jgi:hypothetical protein
VQGCKQILRLPPFGKLAALPLEEVLVTPIGIHTYISQTTLYHGTKAISGLKEVFILIRAFQLIYILQHSVVYFV